MTKAQSISFTLSHGNAFGPLVIGPDSDNAQFKSRNARLGLASVHRHG